MLHITRESVREFSRESAPPSEETTRRRRRLIKRKIFPTHQNYKSQFRHRGEYLNFLLENEAQANGGEVEICKFSCCLLCAVALVLISEYLHYRNYSVPVLCASEKPFSYKFPPLFDISIMIRATIFHARVVWKKQPHVNHIVNSRKSKRQLNQRILGKLIP